MGVDRKNSATIITTYREGNALNNKFRVGSYGITSHPTKTFLEDGINLMTDKTSTPKNLTLDLI